MKIYTKVGDQGKTSLVSGEKVSKGDLRLETYGNVDELNSHIGLLIGQLTQIVPPTPFSPMIETLTLLQHQLFNLGSQLACRDDEIAKKLPTIEVAHVQSLEQSIDEMTQELPALKSFILPGGHIAANQAHVCRTVCRRTERGCVLLNEREAFQYPALQFLNRLSDYFFVLARMINQKAGMPSTIWNAD